MFDSTTSNTFRSAEGIHSGSYGLKFVGGKGAGCCGLNLGISQPDTKTVPGRTYTLSAFIKIINNSSATIRLGFWDEQNNKYGEIKSFDYSQNFDWKRISITVTTPGLITDPKNYYPIIEVRGLKDGSVYLDDVQLEEGTTLTIYNTASAYSNSAFSSLGGGSILGGLDGNLYPATSGVGGLGTSSNNWNSLYLSNATIDKDGNITVNGSSTVKGDETVNGSSTIKGNTTLGDLSTDTITTTGRFNSSLIPSATTTYDLGSSSLYWNNLYAKTLNISGGQSIGGDMSITGVLGVTGTTTLSNLSTGIVQANSSGLLSSNLGTANYILKWNTTGLSTTSTIFDNGNVGIGTTNPLYKLDIAGNLNLSSGSTFKINGTDVLSGTTLGSGITSSSLTSLGTLTALNLSGNITWSSTTPKIAISNGGTLSITDGTNNLAQIVDSPTYGLQGYVSNVPRGVTVVVAANDSSTIGKAQADYVADGVADEVTIKAAIDALPSTGGTVRLMEGTYTIASTLLVKANATLFGYGAVLQPDTSSSVTIMVKANGDHVTFQGFKIDGLNGALNVSAARIAGIALSALNAGLKYITVKDITVDGVSGEGIYNETYNDGNTAHQPSKFYIENTWVLNSIQNGGLAGFGLGADDITVVGGGAIGNARVPATGYGVGFAQTGGDRLHMTGFTAKNNGSIGILLNKDGNSNRGTRYSHIEAATYDDQAVPTQTTGFDDSEATNSTNVFVGRFEGSGNTLFINPLLIGGVTTTSTLTLQPTTGNGATGSDIIFKVGNNGATEAMRILKSGSVGIGTTNASDALEVYGANSYARISANAPLLRFNELDTTDTNFQIGVQAGKFIIETNNDAFGAASTKITVDQTGNLGIGTNTPGKLLDVNGIANIATGLIVPKIYPSADSTTAFQVNKADGTTNVLNIDTTNSRVGILTASPGYPLEVNGNVKTGRIFATAGAANGPAFNFSSDSGSGMWSPGSHILTFSSNDTERIRIDSGGNVGIGTTNPGTYKMYINGALAVNSDTADKTGSTSWGTLSDVRLKDIQGNYTLGLKEVMQLNAIKFNYKADNPLGLDSSKTYEGFSAQDVQKIIPEAISTRADGYLRLDADPIMWAMLNAIKEQQGEITSQNATVSDMGLSFNTKTLTADTIKANQIEGIEFLIKDVTDQQTLSKSLVKSLNDHENRLTTLEQKEIPGLTFDSEKQTIIASNPIDFIKEAIFEGITTFKNAVIYLADVTFGGKVTFKDRLISEDKDLAGYAKIKKGDKEVKVTYEKPYEIQPVVNVTVKKENISFAVTDESKESFTIKLSSVASEDINFSWVAVAIKDVKTYESSGSAQLVIPTPTPSIIPPSDSTSTPSPTPTLTPTIIPILTPTVEASPSPTP